MDKGLVLLVDDEPVVLRIQAAAVQQFGFETLIAETVEEAIATTRAHRPSLIISDVQMPGEGGFDFVDSLEKQGLKNMPVIYLTGYDDIDIIRGGLRAGGDDFVIKGGSVERLRNRIAFWMVSGFQELPSDLRRRALVDANAMKGDAFTHVEDHIKVDDAITERVSARIAEEVATVPKDYGMRLVERVCFLGRLSKIIIEESHTFGHYLRFPDYMIGAVNRVNPPWKRELWPLLKRFEDWSCDTRFVLSGMEPLKPFQQYEWYTDGL
ncbi:response regulator [Kordiimonas lipolytica]|uniref:Response regulator n=1 Tax=Kordiimonas lipolytica TaxID=1662421 RepID=A0ABV8UG86_9PROT|nr:response regulator [Kordiimonas lipolytica]